MHIPTSIILVIAAFVIWYAWYFSFVMKSKNPYDTYPMIPGDGIQPTLIPVTDAIETVPTKIGKMVYKYKTTRKNAGDSPVWATAKEVIKNYFLNGAALIINEKGKPQRQSKRNLRSEMVYES